MESIQKDTQISVKLGIKNLNNKALGIDYSGTIVITTQEEYTNINNKINSLEKKNNNLESEIIALKKEKDEIMLKVREIKKDYENQILNLKKAYEIVSSDLNKFKQGNQKTKFTPEMQTQALRAKAKGWSIAQIHQEFMRLNIDISYETVRRFLSQGKS